MKSKWAKVWSIPFHPSNHNGSGALRHSFHRTSARLVRRYVDGRVNLIEQARRRELEDFFLAAEITEGADVGDDEGGGEAIFGADLAEVDAAVLESEAAAVSVVADLHELALQGLVGEVVADS